MPRGPDLAAPALTKASLKEGSTTLAWSQIGINAMPNGHTTPSRPVTTSSVRVKRKERCSAPDRRRLLGALALGRLLKSA